MASPNPSLLSPAFEALRSGEPATAVEICDRILREHPHDAGAWHLRGILHAQESDFNQAVECFRQAIGYRDSVATYHFNLGLAYQRLQQNDLAVDAYRRAVALKADFLEAQNNLGNLLVEQEGASAAIEHFRDLTDRFPSEAVVQFNLANVLQDAGEINASIEHYRLAIELDPDLESARDNLGRVFADTGRDQESLEVWRQWQMHDPGNPIAQHMIAALTGDGIPARCDDHFVRGTFDQDFARSYETQLRKIEFRVPELIGRAVESLAIDRNDLTVLDAGCGTGLCGPGVRACAKRLIGVDLSADMLGEANAKQIYDELIESELTAYLDASPQRFDLIVCGDTLCYFGDLSDVLAAVARTLCPGGQFVFTVERYQEADVDANVSQDAETFELQSHGRYRHGEGYVRQMLDAAGLQVLHVSDETLRKERGRRVVGMLVTAQRD